MNYNDIITRPVITEKSTEMMEHNKYVFRVPLSVNKVLIKKAMKEIYNVVPEKINVMCVRGKLKRLRYKSGKTSAWKKAIITLKEGDKIEIFDEQ